MGVEPLTHIAAAADSCSTDASNETQELEMEEEYAGAFG